MSNQNRKMKNVITIMLSMILFMNNIYSQEINTQKLDDLFQVLEANDKFMGSVVLSHKGKIIYSKTVGYDDFGIKEKSTLGTKYRVGSISKTFTATLILKAVEEGELDLSEKISTFFPNIENANKIEVKNLLNHSSGVFSITDREDVDEFSKEKQTKTSLLKMIEEGESIFEPGTKSEYSNSNYLLLTFILEDIYKKEYAELLEEKITKPLSLENTYLGSEINIENNECYSYEFEEEWEKQKETDMSVPRGAGAIVSNTTDLSIFIKSLFDEKIISKKSLKEMITVNDNDFGLGIFKYKFGPNTGYGHSGGIDGFSSFLAYIPNDEVSIAFTSNGLNYDDKLIIFSVLGNFYGRPIKIPNFEIYDVSEEDLETYLGIYSSEGIPFKITISKKGNTLFGQVNKNTPLMLEASAKHQFRQDRENVKLEFIPEDNVMVLYEGGEEIRFTRK